MSSVIYPNYIGILIPKAFHHFKTQKQRLCNDDVNRASCPLIDQNALLYNICTIVNSVPNQRSTSVTNTKTR